MLYKISESAISKDIGHYPQTDFSDGYNPNCENGVWKLHPDRFTQHVDYQLKLHEKAHLTDILSHVGSIGMVVSERFKDILEQFLLPRHRFYAIEVIIDGSTKIYYLFHWNTKDFWENIHFEDSDFSVNHIINPKNKRKIEIRSQEEFKKIKQDLDLDFEHNLEVNELILKNDFPNYDLFDIPSLNGNTCISDTLRKEIMDQHISGLTIQTSDILKKE